MLKALAIARTLFLVFIVAFTVRAMPWTMVVSRTFDEQYARSAEAIALLQRAAWYAIAWIAFETAVGWWLATRKGAAPPAGAQPSSPAPPRP